MNHKLLFPLLILLSTPLFSANSDVVSLVAIGSAPTREVAINNALRSAIEQTYGAFISSQTQILNDELVSDEIIAVSSGNVRKYTILSESKNGDTILVSIKAEISVSKLAGFAESHGQSCSYNGDLLLNNIQLMRLRAENTTKCIDNLIAQLSSLYKTAFDFKIDEIGNPIYCPEQPQYELYKDVTGYYFPVFISCFSNQASAAICDLVRGTFLSLSVSQEESKDLENFIGLTRIYNMNSKQSHLSDLRGEVYPVLLAGKQDIESVNKLLDKCLYDIVVEAEGTTGTRIRLLTHTDIRFVQRFNGTEFITERDDPSWSKIEKDLKQGHGSRGDLVYVYEPRYPHSHPYDVAHTEWTTYGSEFFLTKNDFSISKIDMFKRWELINKKKTQTVYRIKLYIRIPEDQLPNFKGFSISR